HRRWRGHGAGSGHRRDEGSHPLPAHHETLVLQLAVRLGHGVRVDRECLHDLFEGGELIPWMHPPQHDLAAHLLHELSIDRYPGPGIDAKHSSSSVGYLSLLLD